MRQKQGHSQIILYSLLFSLSVVTSSCSGIKQLEGFLSADPKLQAREATEQIEDINDDTSERSVADKKTTEEPAPTQPGVQLTKLPKENDNTSINESEVAQTPIVTELPESLPFYPQALIEEIEANSTEERGVSHWRSSDNIETIVNYYQGKWQGENWQIEQPFSASSDPEKPNAMVSKDGFEFKISLLPAWDTNYEERQDTKLIITYQAIDNLKLRNSQVEESSELQNNDDSRENRTSEAINNNSETLTTNENQTNFQSVADLAEAPEQLRQYVDDVTALRVVSFRAKDETTNQLIFEPNEPITRRQYAKWLVKANNKYFTNSPGNKIRLANKSSEPAFKDIDSNDPDFAAIQGLAEAGLIPSVLTNDSSSLLFQPDATLTREDLISWKVPLDIRKGLIKADVNAVQETWGFQDVNKINPEALAALFTDYQNGDLSNIKRIFGYTTLLQPQKAVTRAEAAASLWYFGYQGDGITASEVLKVNE